MKNYAIVLLIFLCPYFPVQANVCNVFLYEKMKLENKIKQCKSMQNEADTDRCRKQIEGDLKQLNREYHTVVQKYQDTEKVLSIVRQIDPQLFNAVSNVRNAEGTLTHVYVRCVNRRDKEFTYYFRHHFKALAYTSASPAADDEHVCRSIYGENTILITIAKYQNEIKALAHEFAHVLYIVPNLKTYTAYIQKSSNLPTLGRFGNGHRPSDPSCKFVKSIVRNFEENYKIFLKNPAKSMALNF